MRLVRFVFSLYRRVLVATLSILIAFPSHVLAEFSTHRMQDVQGSNGLEREYPKPRLVQKILGPSDRFIDVFGLRIFASAPNDKPVLLEATCFPKTLTQKLKIEKEYYGADAFLVNDTRYSEAGCHSFELSWKTDEKDQQSHAEPQTQSINIQVNKHKSGARAATIVDQGLFIFNSVTGNWTKAQEIETNGASGAASIATLSKQRQRFLFGTVAIPKKALVDPVAFRPQSLTKPIDEVDPLSGYLGISPPQPNSKGQISVELPILLRPSRGAGPSFSIAYSGSGSSGALGKNWDLTIPSISVRGPSPLYNIDGGRGYETEDYVFQGQDLLAVDENGKDVQPIYKGGPITPRVQGTRVFRLRTDPGGKIFRRHGDDPGDYYWEVWDPHNGITMLFGAVAEDGNAENAILDPNSMLAQEPKISNRNGKKKVIGQWGLSQEFDNQIARSGSRYKYVPASESEKWCKHGNWPVSHCVHALLVESITYNRSFGLGGEKRDLYGATTIEFGWQRRDVLAPSGKKARFGSHARFGFLVVDLHYLKEIDVWYNRVTQTAGSSSSASTRTNFSKYTFHYSFENQCLNYQTTLESVSVSANAEYDGGSADDLKEQVFGFHYRDEACSDAWGIVQEPFKQQKTPTFNGGNSGIGFPAGFVDSLGLDILTDRSLLGRSNSDETGGTMYIGGGPPGDPTSKPITGGFKVGLTSGKTAGGSTLIDVTGDGIDDIVYRDAGLRYCAGRRQNDVLGATVVYPEDRCGTIIGPSDFSKAAYKTSSFGGEFHAYGAFAGASFNTSKNETYTYFVHRDSDGLIDLVDHGRVYYSQGETVKDGRRVVRFVPNSAMVPPVPGGHTLAESQKIGGILASVPRQLIDEINRMREQFGPVHPASPNPIEQVSPSVRRFRDSQITLAWEAPFDGIVRLEGLIEWTKGKQNFDAIERISNVQESYYETCGLNEQSSLDTCEFGAKSGNPFKFRDLFSAPEVQLSLSRRVNNSEETAHSAFVCTEPQSADFRDSVTSTTVGTDGRYDYSISDLHDHLVQSCKAAKVTGNEQIDNGLEVKEGDVVYLSYNTGPDHTAHSAPDLNINYVAVIDEPAFGYAAVPNRGARAWPLLPCAWSDQGVEFSYAPGDCRLSIFDRFSAKSQTALVTSNPYATTVVPEGKNRVFGGKIRIEKPLLDLLRQSTRSGQLLSAKYKVYGVRLFSDPSDAVSELSNIDQSIGSRNTGSEGVQRLLDLQEQTLQKAFEPNSRNTTALTYLEQPQKPMPIVFEQDILGECLMQDGERDDGACEVQIKSLCDQNSGIGQEYCSVSEGPNYWITSGDRNNAITLSSRLAVVFQHEEDAKSSGKKNYFLRQVNDLDQMLSSHLIWRNAPHVASEFFEKDRNSNALTPKEWVVGPDGQKKLIDKNFDQTTRVYLPISMGTPDFEFVRILDGEYKNPNPEYNQIGGSDRDKINFSDVLSDEVDTVNIARDRQLLRMCSFGEEVFEYISLIYTPRGPPFAPDYLDYWRDRLAGFDDTCEDARHRLEAVRWGPDKPQFDLKGALSLDQRLRQLSYRDKMSSAETLLERVLRSLELPLELLTDKPKITRRGYRLPVKANPLDCRLLAQSEALQEPISGLEGPCRYRLALNFALHDIFADLSKAEKENIRKIFGEGIAPEQDETVEGLEIINSLRDSVRPAFRVRVTATRNGFPVRFDELSRHFSDPRRDAGNEPCDLPSEGTRTCLGGFGSFDRIHEFPAKDSFPSDTGDVFQRLLLNRRSARSVAFSDDILFKKETPTSKGVVGVCTGSERPFNRRYTSLREMEAKQDCVSAEGSLPPSEKYVQRDQSSVDLLFRENGTFDGRNRVLEFEAHPLDVIQFNIELSPVLNMVALDAPDGTKENVVGYFSAVHKSIGNEHGLKPGLHLIPRDPSEVLSTIRKSLECPAPQIPVARIPQTCNPWGTLGWSEIFLGAEYRTYSDAQSKRLRLQPGQKQLFGMKRRRDLLRLHPEIAVPAERYDLTWRDKNYPHAEDRLKDDKREILAKGLAAIKDLVGDIELPDTIEQVSVTTFLLANQPPLPKVGGDWAVFGSPSKQGGDLTVPLNFHYLRFRDIDNEVAGSGVDAYASVKDSCESKGTEESQDQFERCENDLAPKRSDFGIALPDVDNIPLLHRFAGPALAPGELKELTKGLSKRPQIVCAANEPFIESASCWQGQDDTIFFEQNIADTSVFQTPRSTAALIGIERPSIAEFLQQQETFVRYACNDNRFLSFEKGIVEDLAALAIPKCPDGENDFYEETNTEQSLLSLSLPRPPNRPLIPAESQRREVFAPVQRSTAKTISFNGGAASVNVLTSKTRKNSDVLYVDVNGDGFPEEISNNSATLTSPVGLVRGEWWQLFKATSAALSAGLNGRNFRVASESTSKGAGVGLSPPSGLHVRPGGSNHLLSGFPDANLEPSFDASFDFGHDSEFFDLKDFNGDGLVDVVKGGAIQSGLDISLGVGNGVLAESGTTGPKVAAIAERHSEYFNTSNGLGFGVRLGYSLNNGSFAGGMGLSLRAASAEGVLMDFTGDGRTDIVVPADAGSKLIVYPNLGNGFGPGRVHTVPDWENTESSISESVLVDAGAAFTSGFTTPFFKVVFTPGVKTSRGMTRQLLTVRDMNADGAPDIVRVSGVFRNSPLQGPPKVDLSRESEAKIFYNPHSRPDLLSRIVNPSGTEIRMSYALKGNTGPEHGRTSWVVDRVAVSDGFEPSSVPSASGMLLPDGHDISVQAYEYEDGYFNRAEGIFYGFARVRTHLYGCDYRDGTFCALASITKPIGLCTETEAHQSPENCKSSTEQLRIDLESLTHLQTALRTYSNRDIFSQGALLSEVVTAPKTIKAEARAVPSAMDGTSSDPLITTSDDWHLVSSTEFGYSLSELNQSCTPAPAGKKTACSFQSYPGSRSELALDWRVSNPPISLAPTIIAQCGDDIIGCPAELHKDLLRAGFMNEQQAFWNQQSGSLRQRLTVLGVHDASEELKPYETELADKRKKALRSAVGSDFDLRGQVRRFYSVGEFSTTDADAEPVNSSSATALLDYAALSGRPLKTGRAAPLLQRSETLQIFGGLSDDPPSQAFLRARQATYREETGLMSRQCQFPGGDSDFRFQKEQEPETKEQEPKTTCEAYDDALYSDDLIKGYVTLKEALRGAYKAIEGLPSETDRFNQITLTRFTDYDAFGNLAHVVSPLSKTMEWVERSFAYEDAPFKLSPTQIDLTRCVAARAGAGADSALVNKDERGSCNMGREAPLSAPDRQPILHRQVSAIEPHFGRPSKVYDLNANGILTDYDRWGRLVFVARNWSPKVRTGKRLANELALAAGKTPEVLSGDREKQAWTPVAQVDYSTGSLSGKKPLTNETYFQANVSKFVASDALSGIEGTDNFVLASSVVAQPSGRVLQTLKEAEVCVSKQDEQVLPNLDGGLKQRCAAVNDTIVQPGGLTDALGRNLADFEAYSGSASPSDETGFHGVVRTTMATTPVLTREIDGAGRPLVLANRLAIHEDIAGKGVVGSTQSHYELVDADGGARFRSRTITPRCTRKISDTEARGLTRGVWTDLKTFATIPDDEIEQEKFRERDLRLSGGYCRAIEEEVGNADYDFKPKAAGVAAKRYKYDQLGQLREVSAPLTSNEERSLMHIGYDLMGRVTDLNDPDAGCRQFVHDNLDLIREERGYAYETNVEDAPVCGASSPFANVKAYDYAADRLSEIAYSSLTDQGGDQDRRDRAAFFYDRYPHTQDSGTLIEGLKYVPNDHANSRFIDVTGKVCSNCFGQTTLISDRSGARSYSYTPLGLPDRETRSIIAPALQHLEDSSETSETYRPEVAFFEEERHYSAFGDLTQIEFNESVPTNPASECAKGDPQDCIARFTLETRFTPDGKAALQSFNGERLLATGYDHLSRPTVGWTHDGTETAMRYAPEDLRLNRKVAVAADPAIGIIQDLVYQYDASGLILSYSNAHQTTDPISEEGNGSAYRFAYDAGERLCASTMLHRRNSSNKMSALGSYGYDLGHRMRSRQLSIRGNSAYWDISPQCNDLFELDARAFTRSWKIDFPKPNQGPPVHAPSKIDFVINNGGANSNRQTELVYDQLGRLSQLRPSNGATNDDEAKPVLSKTTDEAQAVLSNRALRWDGEGRLKSVQGVEDSSANDNTRDLRERYVYDYGGNRVLKIARPGEENEATTIYLKPYYAKPIKGRGTVQIAVGALPVASLTPPESENTEPLVSYHYADLPVGSVNATLLTVGEVGTEESAILTRREYSPFGLELTNDNLKSPHDAPKRPVSVFHGKELDETTNFSSYGARYYSRDLAMWLSPDPAMGRYLGGSPNGGVFNGMNLATYGYAGTNPISGTDFGGDVVCGGACIAGAVYVAGVVWTAYDVHQAYQAEGATGVAKVAASEIVFTALGGVAGKVVGKIGSKAARALAPLVKKTRTPKKGLTNNAEKMIDDAYESFESVAPEMKGIRKNAAQGKTGENIAEAIYEDAGYTVTKQVEAVLKNGKTTKLDFILERDGKIWASEIKTGGAGPRAGGQTDYFLNKVEIDHFVGKGAKFNSRINEIRRRYMTIGGFD